MFHSMVAGAFAGFGATAVMSAVMLAARAMGISAELPPSRIADKAVAEVRQRPATRAEEQALATVAHFGFGAAAGALYGALARGIRPGPLAPALGTTFGTAVWLVSYQGWVPALGILPPASRDQPGRVGTMLVAHWVYGAVLGIALALLRR